MTCRLTSAGAGLVVWLVVATQLPAQGFGPPDPAMIFNFMDRNQDGHLDPDEIENARGPMRDRLREAGVDYSRGLSRDDFVRTMERSRESEGGDRGRFDRGGFDRGGDQGGSDRGSSDRGSFDRGSFDRGGDRESNGDRSRERSSRDEGRPGDPRGRGAAPTPPPKVRVTLDLQQTFQEGDRDGDGQIGLYEWRQWKGRAQAAEFARLDLNGDGFLTPREIERATAMAAVPVVATAGVPSGAPAPAGPGSTVAGTPSPAAPPSGSPSPSSRSDMRSRGRGGPSPASSAAPTATPATPAATPASPPAAATSAGPSPAVLAIVIDENSPSVRRYRSSFNLLDQDGSGTITSEEWERSTNIRGRMASAKVDLTQPMSADLFVRYLLHLDSASASR